MCAVYTSIFNYFVVIYGGFAIGEVQVIEIEKTKSEN
jgi:hypothetical protein